MLRINFARSSLCRCYTRPTIRCFSYARINQDSNVQALIGLAFRGKPRYDEKQQSEEGKTEEKIVVAPPRQGFPANSPIGSWIDITLNGGDAGEDALVASPMKGDGDWFLAVADGVGGWSENGVDPALFSQSMIYHAAQHAHKYYACPDRLEDAYESGTPMNILSHAYKSTLKEQQVPAGSSTAAFLTFDASKGILRSANLGDSGFMILRPTSRKAVEAQNKIAEDVFDESVGYHKIHFQSEPQTHGFNTPFQLSKLPPEYRIDGSIDSQPKHADLKSNKLLNGDIVLLATDGFWDNVDKQEILQLMAFVRQKHRIAWQKSLEEMKEKGILKQEEDIFAEEQDLANVLAHNLLSFTQMCQFSETKSTPFTLEARKHGIHYPGGKVDDIAIIIALIVEK